MKNIPWSLIDALAEELGVKPEARRKWRERGQVPYRWRIPLLKYAADTGKVLSADDFEPAPKTRKRVAA